MSSAIVPAALLAVLVTSGCQFFSAGHARGHRLSGGPSAQSRDWADPIRKPGLSNFFRVSDNLYRGAHPSAEGFRELKAMGVRTVINLRMFHRDSQAAARAGLLCENIPMNVWNVEQKDVDRFLQIVTEENQGPFFVHCSFGADRTGLMCAFYRIDVQGWTADEAIEEMTRGGFRFNWIWQNLVRYTRRLRERDN